MAHFASAWNEPGYPVYIHRSRFPSGGHGPCTKIAVVSFPAVVPHHPTRAGFEKDSSTSKLSSGAVRRDFEGGGGVTGGSSASHSPSLYPFDCRSYYHSQGLANFFATASDSLNLAAMAFKLENRVEQLIF